MSINFPVPPWRRDFDAARDPYAARNALGIAEATGGPPAPVGAEYVTSSADATLTNERVLTNTASITWDFSTPGQAKANASGGGNVSNVPTPAANQLAVWTAATTIKGDANLAWTGTALAVNGAIVQRNTVDGWNIDSGTGSANLIAAGTSADIAVGITSKGTGAITLYNNTFGRACGQFGSQVGSNTFPTFTAGANQSYLYNNPAGKPINIAGTTDGTDAPAGYVGEFLSFGNGATAIGFTGSVTNLLSINLSAGDWDVWCNFGTLTNASASANGYAAVSISTTSGAQDLTLGRFAQTTVLANNFPASAVVMSRFSLSAAATIWATAVCVGVTSMTMQYGSLQARRRR